MDDNTLLQINRETTEFLARLRADGYAPPLALATTGAYMTLRKGTFELIQRNQDDSTEDLSIVIAGCLPGGDVFPRNDVLLPTWEQFAEALRCVDAGLRGYINLSLTGLQLENVYDLLLQSFNMAPVQTLSLTNNDLGPSGLKFVTSAVGAMPTLKILAIDDNRIDSEDDAASLVKAATEHCELVALQLIGCGIGRSKGVMSAIAPVFRNIQIIMLQGNSIGSHGASLVADCLASNPDLFSLNLQDNLLDDDDANALAESLKTNTKLERLLLAGNPITDSGIHALLTSVRDLSSMNALGRSNHTCLLDFVQQNQLHINSHIRDPRLNRKEKLLGALKSIDLWPSLLIDDIPLGTMPRVLALFQGGRPVTSQEEKKTAKANALNDLFLFVRGWNMPELFTGRIDSKLRTSKKLESKKATARQAGPSPHKKRRRRQR